MVRGALCVGGSCNSGIEQEEIGGDIMWDSNLKWTGKHPSVWRECVGE